MKANMTKRGQKRESKYLLGGNNAIKSNQEEFPETYVHDFLVMRIQGSGYMYISGLVVQKVFVCTYIGKFVYTFVT